MKLLRTEDLNKLLTTNPVTSPTYLGTYPACIIPKTGKKRYSWISNTDSHDEKGEHWCCFCVDDDKLMFFDSYGRSADDPTLLTNYTVIAGKFRKNITRRDVSRVGIVLHVVISVFTLFIYFVSG